MKPSLGSLFAGIGGFDLGFEQAGFQTKWQVEIDPRNQHTLRTRFPHAQIHPDITKFFPTAKDRVDCITAGFPCTDISQAGATAKRRGIEGERSGLIFEAFRIFDALRPEWVVLENVAALVGPQFRRQFAKIIQMFRELGCLGCWRVLDSRYFGVMQGRRRVFMVARLGTPPPPELLSDAAPLEAVPRSLGALGQSRHADTFAAYTLLSTNSPSRLCLGGQTFVHQPCRGEVAQRARESEAHGIPTGLDPFQLYGMFASGNAVVVPVVRWIAAKILREIDLTRRNSRGQKPPCKPLSDPGK